MFITVYTYRARAGEQDAIIALHEDWMRRYAHRSAGYVSGELLTDIHDPQAFVDITHYESEAAAQALATDPEHAAWCRRLASLTEAEPAGTAYHSTWREA
ncbi:MAG: antibiotic biosynthesis monooxygenase [Chloroflexi bacterium]|nr:antibiotic biosynthesis monooxygenase [Chloroflexota bacterium]MBU1752113.1 antibiotic biosynthesis monooxygenase [Chloroflexota bacterium]